MGARRYGISLRVFHSIAHEWYVELNTRREIPYLQATMYYFVYHINTIALYWEEKPTSLMNKNKGIDNPRITIVECVGFDSCEGKMLWIIIIKKKNNGRNFQFTKFSFIDFFLTNRRSLSGKRPNRPIANLPVVDFHSQPRNANIKATEYVTFGFSFSILVFFPF